MQWSFAMIQWSNLADNICFELNSLQFTFSCRLLVSVSLCPAYYMLQAYTNYQTWPKCPNNVRFIIGLMFNTLNSSSCKNQPGILKFESKFTEKFMSSRKALEKQLNCEALYGINGITCCWKLVNFKLPLMATSTRNTECAVTGVTVQ